MQHRLLALSAWDVTLDRAHLGEVHETCAKALDLLIGSHCTEGNLSKALLMEGAVSDATHNIALAPNDCHGAVPLIQDQTGYVLFWHIRQLLREDVLQSNQPAEQHQHVMNVSLAACRGQCSESRQ